MKIYIYLKVDRVQSAFNDLLSLTPLSSEINVRGFFNACTNANRFYMYYVFSHLQSWKKGGGGVKHQRNLGLM